MNVMTHEEIARAVESFLNQHQPQGYRLSVERQGIKQDDGWWLVTVVPDPPDVNAYDYSHHLTEVEDLLREEMGLKVLLVPALVDD
jgi:hypothetical protein